MTMVAPLDAAFLVSETREHPNQVGGLLLFQQPTGSGPDFVGQLYQKLLAWDRVRPAFRRRPATTLPLIGAARWEEDQNIDLEYHVSLSALPRPGRIRELLTLVSWLHASLLDRHRPLWEFHLIEGLADEQFAVYYKVHHALVDGINATLQMMQMFTTDPTTPMQPPIWAELPAAEPRPPTPLIPALPVPDSWKPQALTDTLNALPTAISGASRGIGEVAGIAKTLGRIAAAALTDQDTVLPFQAPRSMFNVPLSGARRYAAQSWSFQRMRAVAKAHDATFNDVLLAMCAGALRRYLSDADALPAESLIAAVPVALPVERNTDGGNAVTMVLCRLATDIADPHERLRQIRSSMLTAKNTMVGCSPLQISALGLAFATGPTAANLIPGLAGRIRPPYNLVISNVPGPRERMFWNGAPAIGWYPVSLPTEGNALNITVVSYAGNIEFGLIGCRRSIPHLQRLLDHLEDSLSELESHAPKPPEHPIVADLLHSGNG